MKFSVLVLSILVLAACATGDKMYKSEITNHRKGLLDDLSKHASATFNVPKIVENISFFAVNAHYNCECTFIRSEVKKMVEMPTYSGINKAFVTYGKALCKIKEQEITLTLYKSLRSLPGYDDLIFLPFKDQSNGESTYGGGRYIDLKEHDVHIDKINIDFNKAYNPWCAYSEGFNCPIPPSDNHLDIAIKAGEKKYKGKIGE